MIVKWSLNEIPQAAKISQEGDLIYLRTELPEFDENTANLRDLSLQDRVAAGWYAVVFCPEPDCINPNMEIYKADYDLAIFDAVAGTCTISKS